MEVIVFESEAYQKLQKEMLLNMQNIVTHAREEALRNTDPALDWINPKDAMELLGVKSKTKMQELRDRSLIVFSQSGRIIKYSKKSILKYLNGNISSY